MTLRSALTQRERERGGVQRETETEERYREIERDRERERDRDRERERERDVEEVYEMSPLCEMYRRISACPLLRRHFLLSVYRFYGCLITTM